MRDQLPPLPNDVVRSPRRGDRRYLFMSPLSLDASEIHATAALDNAMETHISRGHADDCGDATSRTQTASGIAPAISIG
jgi:hypothetical protein